MTNRTQYFKQPSGGHLPHVYIFPNGKSDGFSVWKDNHHGSNFRGLDWSLNEMSRIKAIQITRREAEKIVGRKRIALHVK